MHHTVQESGFGRSVWGELGYFFWTFLGRSLQYLVTLSGLPLCVKGGLVCVHVMITHGIVVRLVLTGSVASLFGLDDFLALNYATSTLQQSTVLHAVSVRLERGTRWRCSGRSLDFVCFSTPVEQKLYLGVPPHPVCPGQYYPPPSRFDVIVQVNLALPVHQVSVAASGKWRNPCWRGAPLWAICVPTSNNTVWHYLPHNKYV